MAYLVIDEPYETYIFTDSDPRDDGAAGMVQEDVSIVDEYPEILNWPDGEPPPRVLGISRRDPTEYRVFPSLGDCNSAGFKPLPNRYWTGRNWHGWTQARRGFLSRAAE
jgi:hypothetical protein